MKRTIIKLEFEKGSPLDIEINGRQLTGVAERAIFYVAAVLLALGAGWAIFNVVLPLIWIVVKFIFSIIGLGLMVLGVIFVVAVIFGLFKWKYGRRGENSFWNG